MIPLFHSLADYERSAHITATTEPAANFNRLLGVDRSACVRCPGGEVPVAGVFSH